jgi:hypothetical protein
MMVALVYQRRKLEVFSICLNGMAAGAPGLPQIFEQYRRWRKEGRKVAKEGSGEGRKEGKWRRKEAVKEGRKESGEGRKEGRKKSGEGRKESGEGRKEGRKAGKEGRKVRVRAFHNVV